MPKKIESIDLSYEVRHSDGRVETWRINARGAAGLRAAGPVLRRLGGGSSRNRRGPYEVEASAPKVLALPDDRYR